MAGWRVPAAVLVVAAACARPQPQAEGPSPSPQAGGGKPGSILTFSDPTLASPSQPQPEGSVPARAERGAAVSPPAPRLPQTSSPPPPTPSQAPSGAVPGRGACPHPKTCDRYDAHGKGWRRGPDGVARVRFYIYDRLPPDSDLTLDELEGAILAATRVWEAASPAVDFVYLGRTSTPPITGDGITVFTWGGQTNTRPDEEGYLAEADIVPDRANLIAWRQCPQRDGGCDVSIFPYRDAQGILTHEIGHALGLGHPPGSYEETDLLTMGPGYGPDWPNTGMLWMQTLGLGDVLGLRALYPCSCPLPPIYAP